MLSVLLATHNGADTIDRTLAAMSMMDAPAGGWKLVVVNNASTDDTEARVLAWRDRLPLEYIVEPKLGKSSALNTALGHAVGDLIIMTDDDVLPDRTWLTEWRRMGDAYPEISIFGGVTVPDFEGSLPDWAMPEQCYTVLYGQTPIQPEGEIAPIDVSGANMAIRKSISDQGWRFVEGFLVGKHGLMGEDSDFVRRLAAKGHKVGFAPKARVRHIVHQNQVSWWWIQRRLFRHGRTMFMLEDVHEDEASRQLVFRFPWWRLRAAAGLALRLLILVPSRDKARIFRQALDLAYALGATSQALTLIWRRHSFPMRSD